MGQEFVDVSVIKLFVPNSSWKILRWVLKAANLGMMDLSPKDASRKEPMMTHSHPLSLKKTSA